MDTTEGDGAVERRPKMKLSVSLDSELVRRADRRWRLTGKGSRSALVEEAIAFYLAQTHEEIPPHLMMTVAG